MKINKVTIKNFRNIKFATYDLKHTNIFTGPNREGKTNTILAIYWALADYLMDGSSDFASFKPIGNEKAEVSVELEFDGIKLKKVFAENWVKTRGSTEATMQGHYTDYFIDDVKMKSITEAKKQIIKSFGLENKIDISKFDLLRAIIDPYYLAEKIDWTILRKFIIELIGDVKNEDVLNTDETFTNVEMLLEHYKYDAGNASKYLKQQISECKVTSKTMQDQQKAFAETIDVDELSLNEAKKLLDVLDTQIAELRQSKITAKNPEVERLEKEISETKLNLSESMRKDQEHLFILNQGTDSVIKEMEEERSKKLKEYEEKKAEFDNTQRKFNEIQYKLTDLKRDIKSTEDKAEAERKRWYEIDARVYQTDVKLPEVNECPKCGFTLNGDIIRQMQESVEADRQHFEEKKQADFELCNATGKKYADALVNLKFKQKEIQDLLGQLSEEVKSKQAICESITAEGIIIKNELDSRRNERINSYTSDKTNQLQKDLNIKDNALLNAQLINTTDNSIDDVIEGKKASKAPLQELLNKHQFFLSAQKRACEYDESLKKNAKAQCDYELQLDLVERFIQTKLSMLKENVSSVFGDQISFTLIEKNIKEGSFNEVCYPSVLGKETPFIQGSGSEKILAGIYLIECIKRKMGLEDLPIIFDESDKLDSYTLTQKVETNAQIISTKVDDINYKQVTLISQ